MAVTLKYRFAMRRRTTAGWASNDEVLLLAEWGVETDEDGVAIGLKIGDGTHAWSALAYKALGPNGVTAGDYGLDPAAPALVGFHVDDNGNITQARSVALLPGNGLSFDIDPDTGAVTISVNSFVANNRVTQAGDTRVTPSGDIRITR
jgi:hypothetical protein